MIVNSDVYGLWDSTISAQDVSGAVVSFQDVVIDGKTIYWSEMRPSEGGRVVIVKQPEVGEPIDVLPEGFNARTRVHEYGGSAFTVHNGIIYFIHYADQRLYQLLPNQKPKALTQDGVRFADLKVTPMGLIAIAESYQNQEAEPENYLALINLTTGEVKKLSSGYDFYSSPAISRDNKHIAWISWNHPNMAWDNTELWVAELDENGLKNLRRIDPEYKEQAFFQPQWGPHSELMVVSDKSNWWNLYQVQGQKLDLLFEVNSELGKPLWNFGTSTWAYYQGGILCTFVADGKGQLFKYQEGKLTPLDLPYTSFSQIQVSGNTVAFIAGSSVKPTALVSLQEKGKFTVLRENTQLKVSAEDLSMPSHITFPSKEGRVAYAYFYPPKNKQFQGKNGSLPPLIVKSHGGPTANCGANLNLEIQYWTSRGFAVVDVNYAGSTGYGRDYRKSLEGNWGIYDVQDCEAAALYLVNKGLVDKNKLAITGGSAGGYTTLAALTFTQTFQVGASHYGVSDLEALVKETHKFESRYLDRLVGPYPKDREIYHARSPIYHVDKLSSPVIFFQGDEDKIVPLDQAQIMYEALLKKDIMTKLFVFKGEQHGFRIAANRVTVLEEQRKFFLEAFKLR